MNTTQITLGPNFQDHGKVEPVRHGDILVTKPFGRVVVLSVDSNVQGEVYLAVRLDTGTDCVVLEREVLYRSR